MNYMIHACPERMWYVEKFLIPSMAKQGIPETDIRIWNDTEGKGNLFSCMDSFLDCGKRDGGTWHLQNDVIICSDFAARTKKHDTGLVCGFACRNFGPSLQEKGVVPAVFLWYSFQCIRIPNELARQFVDWFTYDAQFRESYKDWLESGKHDDGFWKDFVTEEYDGRVINLKPSIVDHVDYLIGGSTVNQDRDHMARSTYWEDEEIVEELKRKLAGR